MANPDSPEFKAGRARWQQSDANKANIAAIGKTRPHKEMAALSAAVNSKPCVDPSTGKRYPSITAMARDLGVHIATASRRARADRS